MKKKKIKNLRQLPSGSWLYRKMIDGITYNITFDLEPTQKEIDEALFERRKKQGSVAVKGTFEYCALKHIDSLRNTASPPTIRAYGSILRNLSEDFRHKPLAQIIPHDIQVEINLYAKDHAPKTTRNVHAFISGVLKSYNPDMAIRSKLPQKVRNPYHIPDDSDVKKFLSAIKGSPYEYLIWLGICGLRRSEAMCISKTDISSDNKVTVNKGRVLNDKGEWIVKPFPKTESSTRSVPVPPYLAAMLREIDEPFKGHPSSMLNYMYRVQDSLGIPRCTFQSLRHYFVSSSHEVGIPAVYIAGNVGHSSIRTTENIYTQPKDEKKDAFDSQILGFLESMKPE